MSVSMAYTGIPQALAGLGRQLRTEPYALIAALHRQRISRWAPRSTAFPMIVLTTTVVIPMIKQAGFDLVWFGDFRRAGRRNGRSFSPPVGFNLFVLQTMSGEGFHHSRRRRRCHYSSLWWRRWQSSLFFP